MATLKISDLSVGDWVRYGGIDYQVKSIDGAFERVTLIGNKEQRDESIYALHPILITAEKLEKNGFVKGQRGDFYHYLRLDKNRTLYIHASTNGWRVEVTYDAAGILRATHLMPDINSVHQLQHALRLAGVDKKINL